MLVRRARCAEPPPRALADADVEKLLAIAARGEPRDEMLVRLLAHRRVKGRWARILFVDDKQSNVESVELWLGKAGIPHQSFRYGAADPRVKSFQRGLAEVQLAYFGTILSDAVASQIRVPDLEGRE